MAGSKPRVQQNKEQRRETPQPGPALDELPDSILTHLLKFAAPDNRVAVNLVCKRWRSHHAEVVHHLAPRLWDSEVIGATFPKLVSLVLEESCGRLLPPSASSQAPTVGPEAGAGAGVGAFPVPVEVSDDDLLKLSRLSSLKALALKSNTHQLITSQRPIISSVGINALATHLTGLEALRLDRSRITGSAMEALSRMTGLRCLHLKEQSNTDDHLSYIGRLTALTSLYLEGCCLGNRGLGSMSSLTSLRTLCISSARCVDADWDVQVTDAGLRCLAALPDLKALDLDCCNNVEGVGLTGLTNLDSLGLSKLRGLTREGVRAALAALTLLTGLDLLDCPHLLGQQGMELWSSPATNLRSLRLCRMLANEVPNWQGHVFLLEPSFLPFCPNLTELNLGQSSFTHAGTVMRLASLAKEGLLPSLRTLYLSACDMEEDLPMMLIGPSQLSDDGLAHLAALTNLQSLNLCYNRNVTCIGLSFLVSAPPTLVPAAFGDAPRGHAGLRGLTELDMTGCDRVGDMGVSWLALHLTGLRVLSLAETLVTDMCLPFFSRLCGLRELSFKGCHHITDAGLHHLIPLKSLQELHFGCIHGMEAALEDNPQVTDSGLERALSHLKSLRVLSLEGCQGVTSRGASLLLTSVTSLAALDIRHTSVEPAFMRSFVRGLCLTRRLNVKVGSRNMQEGLSDVFDLVGRPMYKHCINPPHDWTGACHAQPCECNALWNKGPPPAVHDHGADQL